MKNCLNVDEAISKISFAVGYEFCDVSLLKIAVCHPGCVKNDQKALHNFERLEFLGDRVLGLALAKYLFSKFSKDTEGDLAVRLAYLAGTECLIALSKKTGIIDNLFIPKDFYVSDKKNSAAIADMMEAIFGAVFLDSSFENTQKIIVNLFGDEIDKAKHKIKDDKTHLQEIVQSFNKTLPIYCVENVSGEAHNPTFKVRVEACKEVAYGCGDSKKSAEHDAASNLLKLLATKLSEKNNA